MVLVTAEEMRELDRRAIAEWGIEALELMEQAGRAVARAVVELVEPGVAVVLCGKGNNGGDGFVAARILAENGFTVRVIPVLGSSDLSPEARYAWERLGSTACVVEPLTSPEALSELLENADVVVDAILGTGARAALREPLDWVVALVNASGVPVVAADIPTGFDATTGEVPVAAMRCAVTVALGLPKIGMVTVNGVRFCGQIRVEPLGFPRELLESPMWHRKTMKLQEVAALLPMRPLDANKGTFGLVTVCAGSRWMPGAAVLAAQGALRSGVGLVRLHVPGCIVPIVAPQLPEVLLSATEDPSAANLEPASVETWSRLLHKATAVVIGPGLEVTDGTREFLAQVLENDHLPIVLDADALNLVATERSLRERIHSRCVLTPHPGEMSRLLGNSTAEIAENRWEAVECARDRYGCTVLLKGFGSLVGCVNGDVVHVASGNTALSRGGAGDVLSGVLGGLLAQGVEPGEATILGAFVCGLAADLLVRQESPRGLTISDVAGALPRAWKELEKSLRP